MVALRGCFFVDALDTIDTVLYSAAMKIIITGVLLLLFTVSFASAGQRNITDEQFRYMESQMNKVYALFDSQQYREDYNIAMPLAKSGTPSPKQCWELSTT